MKKLTKTQARKAYSNGKTISLVSKSGRTALFSLATKICAELSGSFDECVLMHRQNIAGTVLYFSDL